MAQATQFLYQRDQSGWPSPALEPANHIWGVQLSTGVEQHVTLSGIPNDNIFHLRFSYQDDADVFVGVNVTAAAPTGTLGAVNAERNPPAIRVQNGDKISLITTTATAYVTFALFGSRVVNS